MAIQLMRLYTRGGSTHIDSKYKDGMQMVTGTPVATTLDFTQLVTVVTAGTPVQGPNVVSPTGWWMRVDPANTGIIHVMFHGQSRVTKGFPLDSGLKVLPLNVENLNELDFDASVNAEKVWFIKA